LPAGGRNDGIHRREPGVIPRRDDQHHAERLAANEALEPVLRLDWHIGERLLGDARHIKRAFLEAAPDLVRRVAIGRAHLAR
jgi:hypothetical protein